MKKIMPQEIEVWYLIPSIRKELAEILINNHGLSQKKTAKILGMTEAAISQYIKSKRGSELKFSSSDSEKIKKSARGIIKNPENTMKIIYNLSNSLKKSKAICELHKSHDNSVSEDCNICFR